MKTVSLNFRTQIDDQYQDPDTNRWVSPLVLESSHNIYEVIVTACPSWDSSSYAHTQDPNPTLTTISKGVGEAFTPKQVQELIELEGVEVSIKRTRDEEVY
tara:strand:- start:1588 stop:1890 length:303 start_codon:yes stop_codon:yes gene_type:complete